MADSDLIYVHLLRGNPLAGGATFGEVTEHMYARAGFVDELGGQERMLALLEGWALDTGLHECQQRAITALEEVAQNRGYPDRQLLAPLLRPSSKQALAVLGWEAALSVVEFQQRFDEVMGADRWRRRMGHDATDLGAHFGIGWAWIPLEAVALFQSRLYMGLFNLPTIRARYVPSAAWTPPPDIDLNIGARPGESAFEFAARFAAWAQQEAERLSSAAPEPLPRGKVPRKTTDRYQRWGSWYARHHLKGESIRQLAIQELGSEDRRKDIRNGIGRAEEILSRPPMT